jgi:hypothetical protein
MDPRKRAPGARDMAWQGAGLKFRQRVPPADGLQPSAQAQPLDSLPWYSMATRRMFECLSDVCRTAWGVTQAEQATPTMQRWRDVSAYEEINARILIFSGWRMRCYKAPRDASREATSRSASDCEPIGRYPLDGSGKQLNGCCQILRHHHRLESLLSFSAMLISASSSSNPLCIVAPAVPGRFSTTTLRRELDVLSRARS